MAAPAAVVVVVMAAVVEMVILLLRARTAQSLYLIGYRLDNLGFRSQMVQEIFLFSEMPRLALAHTQPPIKLVLKTLFPGSKVANM